MIIFTITSIMSSAAVSSCNSLTGIWNAAPRTNNKLVRIQDHSDGSLTAAWWLPKPTTNVSGTIEGRQFRAGNLKATVSASPYMSKNKSGPAPACSLLTFPDVNNAVWCLEPWCPAVPTPPSPPPHNPETFMPMFEVPNAAAQGAFYPNGQPAYFYMNHTGAKEWVIHLVRMYLVDNVWDNRSFIC